MANLKNFAHFLTALALKKAFGHFVRFGHFFGHFLVCHLKIKFSLNILSFVFLDGIHVTHCYRNAVAIRPFFALKCVVLI